MKERKAAIPSSPARDQTCSGPQRDSNLIKLACVTNDGSPYSADYRKNKEDDAPNDAGDTYVPVLLLNSKSRFPAVLLTVAFALVVASTPFVKLDSAEAVLLSSAISLASDAP